VSTPNAPQLAILCVLPFKGLHKIIDALVIVLEIFHEPLLCDNLVLSSCFQSQWRLASL